MAGCNFRVWAPNARRVEVQLDVRDGPTRHSLITEPEGYFMTIVHGLRRRHALPLPCSTAATVPRSVLALPARGCARPVGGGRPGVYHWTDAGWHGLGPDGLVDLRAARRHVHAGGHLRRG